MPEFILDTVVLRVMTFAHRDGLDILLQALGTQVMRCPAEVYNRDEDAVPLGDPDDSLSELARGLRYARRQLQEQAHALNRYRTWLDNATQIVQHLNHGSLIIDPLLLEELPRREDLRNLYGIGRGEAAALTLVERYHPDAVFLSSDKQACSVSQRLGFPHLTLYDVLDQWASRVSPTRGLFDVVVSGMEMARFKPDAQRIAELRHRLWR